MTRNNLSEHLSWLLTAKLSIPPAGDALPPVSLSFIQAESPPTAADTVQNAPLDILQSFEAPATATRGAQAAPSTGEMARLRTETGSAGKPGLVTMGSRSHETHKQSAHGISKLKSAVARTDASAASRPTPFSTARQVPYSPQNDVEVMDLTESLDQARSPNANRVAGRKRKSSEMEKSLDTSTVAKPRLQTAGPMPPPPRGSQQSFTAIDEIMVAPTDPPPPYSTLAPGMMSATTGSVYQTAATSRPAVEFGSVPSPVMPDSEEDDEDLIDFSRSRSRTPACKKRVVATQKLIAPEPMTGSPSKPGPLARSESNTLQDKDVEKALRTTFSPDRKTTQPNSAPATQAPSATITTEEQNEDYEAVGQLFALHPDDIQVCCERLNADYERRLDEVTECMANDQDVDETQKLMDEAEERCISMQKLAGCQEQYKALLEEREQLRATLKAAIRAKSGQDTAKAAMGACRDRLLTLLNDCAHHLDICRDEVISILRRKAGNAEGPRKVAVQSTQAPPADHTSKQPYVPSSSRIAQTQMAREHPAGGFTGGNSTAVASARRESSPNIEAYFSPSRHAQRSVNNSTVNRPHAPPAAVDHSGDDDDDEFGNLNDSDMIEASNQGFSNRMGTPHAPFEDEDGFDDEVMLDFAEDLENRGAKSYPSRSALSRPPLAQTSGNGQTKPSHKSPKKKKKTPSKNDDANLEHLFRFPWSDDVKAALRNRFRLRGFRENQLQAINATLAGKDVFVLMPTGGGKSLCYQLPSLLMSGKTKGVTIVISPLLSLMEDQVQHLRKLSIQAFLINSETPHEKRNAIMQGMQETPVIEDFVQLLYVTPEMLSKSQKMVNTFERLYHRQKLARLVIDEAHCVSQWGHDFRPDYKMIGDVRKRFPKVPVMALTATATENVKLDTVHNLGITGCEILTSSFNRPNLYYEVRPKPKGKQEDVKHIAELIKDKYARKCGIIYCLSRKNCETMAAALCKEHKIKAHHYHAGLAPEQKREIQKDWQAGVHHVIVATIAFGMGIDKPDVRFVIHHTIPKSLEGYYQETGRAGRDSMPSGCYLFYGYQDVGKLRRMIDEGEGDWQQKERQHQMLRKMAQYCDNRADCRRVQVLQYFNEDFDPEDCGGECDNCCSESNFHTLDVTPYAQDAVNMVSKIAPQKVTLLHCMDVFRGAASKKISDKGHNALNEFGKGSDLERGDIERLFYHLLTERAIIEENHLNKSGFANQYVELGKHCNDFLTGRRRLEMQIRSTPKPKSKAAPKKKSKKDPFNDQSKNWKKTAGSTAAPEMPMSTNISSPIQAAASRTKPNQRGAGRMHDNGYQRDNFVVSDPDDEDNGESEGDDFSSDGFAPIRTGGQRTIEKARTQGPPITADEMMENLDEVERDAVEGFVREGAGEAKKLVVAKGLRRVPFSDTMLRHMAIERTKTPDEMLQIPGINPENVRLYGKKFCKLVKDFQERYDAMMLPDRRADPDARNVIDLVSDEEEESEDEYGDFSLDEDEGEASGYFPPQPQPRADVAAFTARIDQFQAAQPYTEPGPAKQKKGAKGGKKRTYKATGSNAAPRRKPFSGNNPRLASYAYEGPTSTGVGKRKVSSKRKSGGGGKAGGAGGGSGMGRTATNNAGGASRGIISMMPT